MEEPWTILKVLEWTKGYFARKGVEEPRAAAEVLLAHALGLERLALYLQHDRPLNPSERAVYREFVRRRAAREPTQYITGHQEFWSLDFEVGPCVLVPRPETERLVEVSLEMLRGGERVLDLCTGCGAVAVALARERPSLTVVASDRSSAALQVARRNARRHGVEGRVHLVAGDLLGPFKTSEPSFDLVASNPPYVSDEEMACLAPEIRCHEPRLALEGGGSHGLETIRRIVRQAPLHLKPGGFLLVEIGRGQAEILEKELARSSRFRPPEFFEDYSGILRVMRLAGSGG